MPITTYTAFAGTVTHGTPGNGLAPGALFQIGPNLYSIIDDFVIPANATINSVVLKVYQYNDATQSGPFPGHGYISMTIALAYNSLLYEGSHWVPSVAGNVMITGFTPGYYVGAYVHNPLTGMHPITGTPWTRAQVFAGQYGWLSTVQGLTPIPGSPGTNVWPSIVGPAQVVINWSAFVGQLNPPPPPTWLPPPLPPVPCCPMPQPPYTPTNPPICPCLPGTGGAPGAPGLPGTNGAPGGRGARGPGGPGGTSPTVNNQPPSIGPGGGGGGGGSGFQPPGVGWNANFCTNVGGTPQSYATIFPFETFREEDESQFWFEITPRS